MHKTITIPTIPITHNELLRQAYRASGWRPNAVQREKWRKRIRTVAGLPRYDEPQGKVRVTITVYRGRRQDPDNVGGSLKPVLDALKDCGWIVDDSPKWIDLVAVERTAKKAERRTVIELEDGI